MGKPNVRVILASGHPKGRRFLRAMVEDEPGAVVIGQAENAPGTLALARSLRPDVVIIDSHLPHTMVLDTVPLTQIGGLDAAQAATREIPNTHVVLLNTDTIPREGIMSADFVPLFSRETGGTSTPFTLQELTSEAKTPDSLVFASVQISPNRTLKSKITGISDKAMMAGALAILLGLILIVTLFLAVPGSFIVLTGAAMLIGGAAAKVVIRLWDGLFRHPGRGTINKTL
ncbi:MAG: hypothetical protein V1823_04480 [Chloroflexota bacterium]